MHFLDGLKLALLYASIILDSSRMIPENVILAMLYLFAIDVLDPAPLFMGVIISTFVLSEIN